MEFGFVRLSRKIFEHSYWLQKRSYSYAEAWIDLIQMARYDENPFVKILTCSRQITINRGEIHASIRYLAERWSWSTGKTRRFLDASEEKKEIERKTAQGETIIRLCNYDTYNPLSHTDRHTDKHSSDTPIDTPTDTNNKKDKKGKEFKESKELNDTPPPKGDLAFLLKKFDEFRIAYRGTRRGLETELADFKHKHKDWKEVIPLLMPALEREVKYRNQLINSEQFEPNWKNLKTWLNQRCWEQEFTIQNEATSIPQSIKVKISTE